jgi:hypothetical protein
MMSESHKRIEFRIPISPTPSFFSQVRFFNYALRRLGAPYDRARLLVVVGDHCDIEQVCQENRWSEDFNIVWERVPDDVFAEFGIWGTANWRLNVPVGDSDIIILSDADTVLLRDFGPLLSDFPIGEAAVRGHMAHAPPPVKADIPGSQTSEFWPWLFGAFNVPWPNEIHRYSMDKDQTLPLIPAYFNLGFVAMSAKALAVFDREIADCERKLKVLTESQMRCQMAVTIVAHRSSMNIETLSAAYNAANYIAHMSLNELVTSDIRVLHYLRLDEIDRSRILLPEEIDGFLSRPLNNPANRALQELAREYRKIIS